MTVTFEKFSKAVQALEIALNEPKSAITRDATIQRFEFCVELAWKTSKKVMGTNTSAPKQVIREMAQNNYISNIDGWLQAIDERNLSSHTYNEELAERVYQFAKSFFPEFQQLLDVVKDK